MTLCMHTFQVPTIFTGEEIREHTRLLCWQSCPNSLMKSLVTSWVDSITVAEVSFHGNLNRSGKGQCDLAAITPRWLFQCLAIILGMRLVL